jgi:hypothetical protein
MSHDRVEPSIAKSGLVLAAVLVVSVAAGAESPDPRLFDDYNFKLEGSWVAMNTAVRLDSKTLGMGTELRFEDDLNLDANKLLPSLSFEWQISDRHRLGARWQDISRDSNSQALKEIQWGDEIIPIDSDIRLAFDVTQYSVDWTYYAIPLLPDVADERGRPGLEHRVARHPSGGRGLGAAAGADHLVGLHLADGLGDLAPTGGVSTSIAWMMPSGSMMNRPRSSMPWFSS